MRAWKITGFVVSILGICVFLFGTVVSAKVAKGESEINTGQRKVNTIRTLSKINPFTKKIVKIATQPAQQKINKGEVSAGKYKTLALWLRIGGVVLFVVGALLIFYGYARSSRR